MAIEIKSGSLKSVDEGTALVRLATLDQVDMGNDVVTHGFFPTAPPLKVSIQPYHRHDVPSLGHAHVWEDTLNGEVLGRLEFNDSQAAQEQFKVLKWDFEHGPIQNFSWAFRIKSGAARQGAFEGRQARFLGKADDGSAGVDLMECGPVLRGASVNSGLIGVRSQGIPLTRSQQQRAMEIHRHVLQGIVARHGPPIPADDPMVRRLHTALLRVDIHRAKAQIRRTS